MSIEPMPEGFVSTVLQKMQSLSKQKAPDSTTLKLRSLSIQNFKAIDNLELDFPAPLMPNDPDIWVLGSRNGVGKTSVLEACAMLALSLSFGQSEFEFLWESRILREFRINPWDLLVRAGATNAVIKGNFELDGKSLPITVQFNRQGNFKVHPSRTVTARGDKGVDRADEFIRILSGVTGDPLIWSQFLYFHSYRKIQEGHPEFGSLVRNRPAERAGWGDGTFTSVFKIQVLRALMSLGGLFEGVDQQDAKEIIDTTNILLREYTGGEIGKLRPFGDNAIEFRINPAHGADSYTFDGLSSGQKEIISTLFLIWSATRNEPGVVLIDEPELHLNPEWHSSFVHNLAKLAPQNQYILATHSEDVFVSVDRDHRLLLCGDQEAASL